VNVASGARQLLHWATSGGPGPVLTLVGVVVAAFITGGFVLLNGSRQRRQDSLARVAQATAANRAAARQRLDPAARELMRICADLEVLASHLTHNPDQDVQEAPQAIREARRRLDLMLESELRGAKDELIAINGRIVQWFGIEAGLLADAAANRTISPQLGHKVDDLEDEVAARLAAVRAVLEAALVELNR
jgi:hypothetical protein